MSVTLQIKNMVCQRCVMAVEQTLNNLSLPFQEVRMGEVILANTISDEQKNRLNLELNSLGFELIADKRQQMVERVKNVIVELIHHQHVLLKVNLSDYLNEQIGMDYTYISKVFSEMEHTTIEKYVILQKIERVKELISYNELTISEIADQLHYSSVAHLSAQFKKITGQTPSAFKSNGDFNRKPLNEV